MSRFSNNQRSESSGFYYDGSNNPYAEYQYTADRAHDGPARDGGEKPRMVWDEVDECYVEDRRTRYSSYCEDRD